MKNVSIALLSLATVGCATGSSGAHHQCLFEGFAFEQFASIVRDSGAPQISDGFEVRKISLTASDGVELRGHLYSREEKLPEKVIYVLQGNAIRHDHVANYWLQMLSEYDLDAAIVAFDYRGFRISDGEPSGTKLISDTQEIAERLSNHFESVNIYAQSFGVLITLNAYEGLENVDKIVVDSMAAKLPWIFSCPASLQPINSVPQKASNILYLYGNYDSQVSISSAERLGDKIRSRGGAALGVDGGHPSNSYREFSARAEAMRVFFELDG